MTVQDVIFSVALVVGCLAILVGLGIVATARVPGPPSLFGRVEPGDTARARLIGWQCALQGVLPGVIGAVNLFDGLATAVKIGLMVVLLGAFVGTFLINRRLGVRP